MELRDALKLIVKHRETLALKWAVGYAQFALDLVNANATPYNVRNQLLYLQGNITYWRHPQAKDVRAAIKQYITEHKEDF